jgi:hypothetical protein
MHTIIKELNIIAELLLFSLLTVTWSYIVNISCRFDLPVGEKLPVH